MIKLAKTLQNSDDMITLAKIFVQQPRIPTDDLAVPYCQKAPQNAELNGFYQCQFKGVTQGTFAGNLPAGDKGTIPFGLTAPVNPAGSWYAICIFLPLGDTERLTWDIVLPTLLDRLLMVLN